MYVKYKTVHNYYEFGVLIFDFFYNIFIGEKVILFDILLNYDDGSSYIYIYIYCIQCIEICACISLFKALYIYIDASENDIRISHKSRKVYTYIYAICNS